ncbi:MAG: HlyD family type I secretion periplasmic adaptor subunit, partial [Rhodospirillales bacterium]|nr:HlyD family type I secretion periplasmic adaptor subunit [Rhodospirillales bacterium]
PAAAVQKVEPVRESAFVRLFAEGRLPGVRGRVEDFLPDTEAIAERRHSPYATWLIYGTAALVVAVVLWMNFSKVDEVATAPGIVRPAGKAKVVSHPEGGRVAKVLVKDGDIVREGQELILLDADLIDQEIAKVAAQHQLLSAEVARLEAETSNTGRPPTFPANVPAESIAKNLELWQARQAEIGSRRSAADSVVGQSQSRLATVEGKIRALEDNIRVLSDQAARIKRLVDEGVYPLIRYQTLQRELIDKTGELQAARDDLRTVTQAFAEATERRAIVDREWNSLNFKRLGDALAERARAGAALEQQQQLRRNLVIRAPADGIVNGLKVHNAGASIRPGDPIVGVVPAGEARKIEIEVRVTNNDIGVVEIGQPATVKFQTYDWIRYGTLRGKVTHIAADATAPDPAVNPQAAAMSPPYFVVLISVDCNYLGGDECKPGATDAEKRQRRYPLSPGMTCTVDLQIGERTILGYFTDRVFKTVQGSMRERGT